MRSRRGVALIMVLWIVVILGSLGAGVARSARTSMHIADNARADLIGRAAAESGIEAMVAAIEDTLSRLTDIGDRRDWLNTLTRGSAPDSIMLGDGRFSVVLVDVSARLDVNAATEPALQVFFSQFTDPGSAATIAKAIRTRIEPEQTARPLNDAGSPLSRGRQSATPIRSLGGRQSATPIRSLEELRIARLVPDDILGRAAQYLTVDGDGAINARTASDTVLAAASGELREEPSRLLLVSRGWVSGNPLTCEIQAVYAITGNRLVFSHWRERAL